MRALVGQQLIHRRFDLLNQMHHRQRHIAVQALQVIGRRLGRRDGAAQQFFGVFEGLFYFGCVSHG